MFGVFVCIAALLFHELQQIESAPSKLCILPEPLLYDKWFTTQGRLMSFGRRNYTAIYKTQGRVQVKRSPEAYETHCLSDRKVQLSFKFSERHFQCLTLTMIRRGLVLVEKIDDRAVMNDVIDCQDNRISRTRDVEQFVLSRYMPNGVKYGKAKCWTAFTSGSSKTAAELFIQSKMKFPDCMRTCVALGYRVFGFLNGSSCICAHDTKETFKIIAGSSGQAIKMCQVPCIRQHASVYPTSCGGTDHISTYYVETVENEGNFRYEDDVGGCWADIYVPGRHHQMRATFFMSPALCVRFCSSHGFLYAATSEGRVCTCRNTYGMLGKGRRCTAKCIGEQEVHGYCGNVNRPYLNNVYQVVQFSSDTVKRRIKPELRGTWYTSTVPQRIVQVHKRKILITEIQPHRDSLGMKSVIGTDEILDISPHVTRVRYFWVSEGHKYHVCLTFVMSDDNRTVDVTYVEASTDRFNNPCAMRSRNPDLRSYSQFAISRSPLSQNMEYTEVGCYFQDRANPVMYEAARHDNTGVKLGECARFCYVKQLPYFAIMSRRLCYCGYGGTEEVLDSRCLAECGMTNFPCNKTSPRNMFTMKMYKIDKASFSKPAAVGCVNLINFLPKECAIKPLLRLDRCKLKHTNSKMMSPALCAHMCPKKMEYIHVYQGTKCHCGETLEDSPTVPFETCDSPCPGNNSERCGGGETFASVYRRIPRNKTSLFKLHTVPRLRRQRRTAGSKGHPRSSVWRRHRPAQTNKLVKPVTLTKPGRPSKPTGPGKPANAIKHIKPTKSARPSKTIKSSNHARFSRAIKAKPAKPKQNENVAKTPCQVVYDILREGSFYASPVGNRIVNFMPGYKFQTSIKNSKLTNRADPIYVRTSENIITEEAEQITCFSDTIIRLVVKYKEMTSCMTLQIISKDVIEVENIKNGHHTAKTQLCSRQISDLWAPRYFDFVLSKEVVNRMLFRDEKCHPSSQTETALLRSRKFHITAMTFPACVRTCIYLGYYYFGMLSGTCICFHNETETFWTGEKVAMPNKWKCSFPPCKSDFVPGYPFVCGGKRNILSYRILGRSRSRNHPHAVDKQYLGCWADEYDVRHTPIWTARERLPLESCLDFCSNMGTLYAAVSSRKICTCANHYGRLGPGEGEVKCSSKRIKSRSWRCGSAVIPYYHSVYIVTRYPPEAMKETIPKDFRGFWYTHTSPRRQLIIYENNIFMRTIPDVSKPDDVFYMTSRNIISPGKYMLLVQDFKKHSDDAGADRSCFIMILSKDFISAVISYRKSNVTGSRSSYPCHVIDKNLDKSSFDKYAVRRVPLPKRVGYKDQGCYFYNRHPLFSMAPQTGSTRVDKPGCARFCHAQDYQYFYIMNKTQCFCSDGLSEKVLDAACTAKCGQTTDTCSGNKTELKIPVKEYRIDGQYLMIPFTRGCVMPGDSMETLCNVMWTAKKVPCLEKKESSDVMQPRLCARLCYPHRYFYIYNLTTCYCDMKDINMPNITESACRPCPGDVRAFCGGSNSMTGYDSHGRRFEAKPYARKSPPPLPLAKMNNKEAWKKPKDLFKDFFTSVDRISNWTEDTQQEPSAFVTKSPEVLSKKTKKIQAVKENLYGNMRRLSCEQIPEQIQNHNWWSSMDQDRQIVFRKLHYETASPKNSTRDPFHGVWKTTPTAYEKRCYSDLKIQLKFKFSWRFSQCLTLTILRPTVIKVQLIHHRFLHDNPLDCTHTNTSKDRSLYEFALTRHNLNQVSFGYVKCFRKRVLKMYDRYIRLEGRRDDIACLRTCVSLGYSSFGFINSLFYICTHDERQAFGSCFGPNNEKMKKMGRCNEILFHFYVITKHCDNTDFITVGQVSQFVNRRHFLHNDQVDGCLVDRYVPERHLRGGVPKPTPESCSLFCSKRGFLYAAGSSGKYCTCMNDYGLFGSGENCTTKWPGDWQNHNPCGNAEAPHLYSVYKILNFDDDRLKQVISPQFQGVWFTSTLPPRQIIIYEYQVFTRTIPEVTEPDDMELIEADEILQISENLLRIRQHWSQDGKDHHACMIIERAKHGNTAFVTYILANTNRSTNPCSMREKEKLLVKFSQFVMSRRPVPEEVSHELKACYYLDLVDPIMYSAVMFNNEAVDESECARFCYVTGLPYAAIMLKKHCYCGYGALDKVKDRRCQVLCGEKNTSCHHKTLSTRRTMRLYRVGGVQLPSLPSIGCFQLTALLRDQCGINTPQRSTDCYMMKSYPDFMSPKICAQLCPGDEAFIYILNRLDCYCSSKEFHIDKVDENKCDQMCTDNTDLRCGGFNYISVYKNSAPATAPAWNNDGPSTPPLPFTDMRKHMSSVSRGGKFSEYFEKLDEIIEQWHKKNPGNFPLRQEAADDEITQSGRYITGSGRNIFGSVSDSDTVPDLTGEVLVQVGRGAILKCFDNDAPPPSGNLKFQWMKGDIPVTDSRFTVTPNGELKLRHAELGDSAEYSCQVKGQDDDYDLVNDKVKKTLIVFLLPDTRYLVRLKYHVTQCDGYLAKKKMDLARETLCTSNPCPFVNFQAHCHGQLHTAGMREELWLSLTIEPGSDFVAPQCAPECMEKATVKHLQQELHLVKQFISTEKNNGTQSKLNATTILANETVKQLVQGCPAGFIRAHKVCTPCHPGTYAQEKDRECHPCQEGFYQPYFGTYKCYKCPRGSSKGLKGAASEDSCLNVVVEGAVVIGIIGGSSVAALVVVIAASVIVYRYTSLCSKPRSKTEEEGGGHGDFDTDGEKLVPRITLEGVTSDCGDVSLLVPKVTSRLSAQPYARSSNSADSIGVESPGQHPALLTASSYGVRSRSYSHGSGPIRDTYSNRGNSDALDQRHTSPYGSRQMVNQPRAAGNPNYGPTQSMSQHPNYQSQLHEIRYAGSSYNDGVYTDVQLVVPDVPPRHRSRSNANETHVGEFGPPRHSSVYAPGHGQTYSAGSVYNTGAHGPSQYDGYYYPEDQTF